MVKVGARLRGEPARHQQQHQHQRAQQRTRRRLPVRNGCCYRELGW